MPYIPQKKRDVLDPAIDKLYAKLIELSVDDENDNMDGNLNYTINRLLRMLNGTSYREINDTMGMLFCTALEYYRTQAVPYEEMKRAENGDVDAHGL